MPHLPSGHKSEAGPAWFGCFPIQESIGCNDHDVDFTTIFPANILSCSRVLIRIIDKFLNNREASEAGELNLVGVADLIRGDDSSERSGGGGLTETGHVALAAN